MGDGIFLDFCQLILPKVLYLPFEDLSFQKLSVSTHGPPANTFTVVITQFVMVNCTAVEYNDALELSFQSKCLLSFKMYLTYLFELITMMFTGLRTAKVFSSLSWTSDQMK